MIEAFFNIEIMKAAWPIVLTGLWNTILIAAQTSECRS